MSPFKRTLFFLLAAVFIIAGTLLLSLLARGYSIDLVSQKVVPNGLLVATSTPDGAQVVIDGQLKTATNNTLSLPPGKYLVEIRKDSFSTWSKEVSINKEEVIKTESYLFPAVPSFRPITFSGAANPHLSPSGDRIVFAVPAAQASSSAVPARPSTSSATLSSKPGLWVVDLVALPLGFSREPRQITHTNPSSPPTGVGGLDWTKAEIYWSPDGSQVLAVFFSGSGHSTLKSVSSAYLLDPTQLNDNLTDVSATLSDTLTQWQKETSQVLSAQETKIPPLAQPFFASAAGSLKFSPDETRVLYQATHSATLADKIIPAIPGSDSQPQQRTVHRGGVYVYDLKEDRNFYITDLPLPGSTASARLIPTPTFETPGPLSWLPTSRHLLEVQNGKISVIEYDNTNQTPVFIGSFADGDIFSYPDVSKLVILTDLGSPDQMMNLYALSLR